MTVLQGPRAETGGFQLGDEVLGSDHHPETCPREGLSSPHAVL